jgi:hypothetical protein
MRGGQSEGPCAQFFPGDQCVVSRQTFYDIPGPKTNICAVASRVFGALQDVAVLPLFLNYNNTPTCISGYYTALIKYIITRD